MNARAAVQIQLYFSLTSALYGDGWSKPRPGRSTPAKKEPIPIVHEAE
jgi:hypothetical protein